MHASANTNLAVHSQWQVLPTPLHGKLGEKTQQIVTYQGFIQDLNLGGGNEGVSCKFKFCEGVSCKFLSITSLNPQLAWGGGKVALGGGNPRFPPPCMKPCLHYTVNHICTLSYMYIHVHGEYSHGQYTGTVTTIMHKSNNLF